MHTCLTLKGFSDFDFSLFWSLFSRSSFSFLSSSISFSCTFFSSTSPDSSVFNSSSTFSISPSTFSAHFCWMRRAFITVFPRIVSAETILFWIWPYVLWPLVTVHKSGETIQGRKLFKGGNYSRKYGISYPLCVSSQWLY